jgi:hypothetical protein
MALYTKNGCWPQHIPDLIQLEDESIRTDATTYTDEEIASAGWTVAPDPITCDPATHRVKWNSETSEWYLGEITAEDIAVRNAELIKGVRSERNSILDDTDYMVIKALEAGTTLSDEWVNYRQALRDITNQSDPLNITWPTKPS